MPLSMRIKKDEAKTPYQRLISSSHINKKVEAKLKTQYKSLNPIELKKNINKLQDKLYYHSKMKEELKRKEVNRHHLKHILPEAIWVFIPLPQA